MLGDNSYATGPFVSRAGAKKPVVKLPPGYGSEDEFLSEMRQDFYDDIQYDRLNREAALEDTRFIVGDQWDDIVRQRREAARKPVLIVNRLPAFVAQVVGQRRMNETEIKILPDDGGTTQVAKVREGLVRQIQKASKASIAYDKALENSTIAGIGNFDINLAWTDDEVWTQSIKVRAINDALSVVWDRMLNDPSGADAGHVFVVETMKKDVFYSRWPWATAADIVVDVTLRGDLRMNGWIAVDDVRIVSYWKMRTKRRTIALMQDGSTQDITSITDGDDEQLKMETLANVQQNPDTGEPYMREVDRKYAQWYLCSGLDILEGPYDLPIDRVPVLRVPGWEVNVGEWKHRWGLIRFLKDPQRLHNYWRSVWAEKIMQTPRAVWLASQSSVAGRENAFRNSHLSDDPLLIWNDDTGNKPERVPPAQIENSLMAQAEMTNQDIKDVSNIHEANLGMPSNEVSGAAIMARQRVSDTGTIIYHDNLNYAIEEAGRIINQLIPVAYDTPRIIKILGEDAKEEMVEINKTKENDITIGKYSVTVKTGPNTATKRIEAAENMMTLINAMPQVASLIADLIVEAQDWPMADEIARRLRAALPPGILNPSDMTPEEQQAAAGKAQAGAQASEMNLRMAIAAYLKTTSEAQLNSARAQNFVTQSDVAQAREQTSATNVASQAAERELSGHLEAIRVADGK